MNLKKALRDSIKMGRNKKFSEVRIYTIRLHPKYEELAKSEGKSVSDKVIEDIGLNYYGNIEKRQKNISNEIEIVINLYHKCLEKFGMRFIKLLCEEDREAIKILEQCIKNE